MAADRNQDLEALNAFVDGELPPDEHAAVAARIAADPSLARAHATLTRLRAGIADYAAGTEPPVLTMPSRRLLRPVIAAAAAVVALLAGVALVQLHTAQRVPPVADASRETALPVALGSKPMIPDLSAAGLTLVRVDGGAGRPLDHLVAVYTGPRGCRLELHVQSLGSEPIAAPQATHRHQWVDGAAIYELLAFGMPPKRFAVVAEAAERQTRALAGPDQHRLREARKKAPPCVG